SRLAFSDVPPITLGLARLLIGVVVLAAALRRLPPLRERGIALLGLILAVTLMLQFWGTDLAGAAAGSLLTLTTPVFVALMAAFTVVGAGHVRRVGALAVTTGASVWAIPFMLPGAALELLGGQRFEVTEGAVLSALYLGVFATALAWWAWYRGVERLPAATSG